MPQSFTEQRAKGLIKLEDLTNENREAFVARYTELLSDHTERDEMEWARGLLYFEERMAEESGSAEMAEAYADTLEDLVALSWDEINDVPTPARGSVWTTARALMSVLAEEQALLEIQSKPALSIGAVMCAGNASAAKRLSTAQKKKTAVDGGLKKTIAAMAKPKDEGKQ